MDTDPTITAAREFLELARKRPVETMPPSVLARECAELRRTLGQVLSAAGAAVTLSPAEVLTALSALAIAARWDDLTAGAAEEHLPTGHASAYRALSRALGDAQAPRAGDLT